MANGSSDPLPTPYTPERVAAYLRVQNFLGALEEYTNLSASKRPLVSEYAQKKKWSEVVNLEGKFNIIAKKYKQGIDVREDLEALEVAGGIKRSVMSCGSDETPSPQKPVRICDLPPRRTPGTPERVAATLQLRAVGWAKHGYVRLSRQDRLGVWQYAEKVGWNDIVRTWKPSFDASAQEIDACADSEAVTSTC